jgi:hypothetical protein
MRRRGAIVLAAWAMAGAWLGCNALLGIESAVFEPDGGMGTDDEGGPGDTGRPEEEGASLDGSSLDGADADVPDVIVHPCTDTTSDPFNCGTCGHDCLGGLCSVSRCVPVVIANEPGSPAGIAVDSTHVYWTNSSTGDVRRAPIAGGAPETIYDGPTGTFLGEGLVRTGADVYFAIGELDGGVYRCPATGCGGAGPTAVIAPLAAPGFVALADGGELLVAESTSSGRIGHCKLPCASGAEFIAGPESFPIYVAMGGDAFYWSTLMPGPGNLRAKLGDASAPVSLATSQAVKQMEVKGDEVLFAVQGSGLKAVPLDGGTARRVYAPFMSSERFAIDGTNVYFNEEATLGRILRCPIVGCNDAGATIAASQIHPHAIAVDKKSVYWTNTGDGNVGTVMRVAK